MSNVPVGVLVDIDPTPQSAPATTVPSIAPTDRTSTIISDHGEAIFPSILAFVSQRTRRALAVVNGAVGGMATKIIHQSNTLTVTLSPFVTNRFIASFRDTREIGMSKRTAISYLKHIELQEPSYLMAHKLLELPLSGLRQITIQPGYLQDLVVQAHAMYCRRSCQVVNYRGYYTNDIHFNFTEAKLLSHLFKSGTDLDVEINLPESSLQSQLVRPVGHYREVANRLRWQPVTSEPGSNVEYMRWTWIRNMDYLMPTDEFSTQIGFWAIPDLGDRLNLNQCPPVRSLKVILNDARACFIGLPAFRLTYHLSQTAVFGPEGIYPRLLAGQSRGKIVRGLTIIDAILHRDIPEGHTVTIVLPTPEERDVYPVIRAKFPTHAAGSFFNTGTQEQIDFCCGIASDIYVENLRMELYERHATTDARKEIFGKIRFETVERSDWIVQGWYTEDTDENGNVIQ
jgi:hypothetical protein